MADGQYAAVGAAGELTFGEKVVVLMGGITRACR